MDQIHLPDPVLQDIKELQNKNIELKEQLEEMAKGMRCMPKRGNSRQEEKYETV